MHKIPVHASTIPIFRRAIFTSLAVLVTNERRDIIDFRKQFAIHRDPGRIPRDGRAPTLYLSSFRFDFCLRVGELYMNTGFATAIIGSSALAGDGLARILGAARWNVVCN